MFPGLPKSSQRAFKAAWAMELLHVEGLMPGAVLETGPDQVAIAGKHVAVYSQLWSQR